MQQPKVIGLSYKSTSELTSQTADATAGVEDGDSRATERSSSLSSDIDGERRSAKAKDAENGRRSEYGLDTECTPSVISDIDSEFSLKSRSPFRGNALSLVGVSYSATYRDGSWWKGCCLRRKLTKEILQDVDLQLVSGQLTAILGNSGSGKTSLLDVISSTASGKIKGNVLFNHTKLNRKVFRAVGGYVIQADRLLPNLTVLETLTSTAQLKFMGKLPQDVIQQKVAEVIDEMGLRHVADSRIGGLIERGISGGEKRRVSIAAQLLQDPKVLLLDEPTTGLDSFTAHSLVQSLAALAHNSRKIVLMSVHQPRSDIFNLFDNVGLLCVGQVVYFGPGRELVSYFTNLGYPCPVWSNPLDHYVDLASLDHRSAEAEASTLLRVAELTDQYRNSDVFVSIKEGIQEVTLSDVHQAPKMSEPVTLSKEAHYMAIRTWILLKRMTLESVRDRGAIIMRLVTHTVFALYIWLFLWQLGHDLPSAIQDRSGLIYQTVSSAAMIGVLNAYALLPPFRNVYYRESADGLYGCFELCTAYYLHIFPCHIVSCVGYALWTYWGVGMYPEWERFAIYFAVLVLLEHLGELQMVMALSLFNSPQVGQSFSTLIISVGCLYATGLLKTFDTMPELLQWLAYMSFLKYSTEILVTNEYHQLNFTCPEEPVLPCEYYTGDLYLSVYFPDGLENMALNFGVLIAFVAAFWILCVIIFRIRGEKHLQ